MSRIVGALGTSHVPLIGKAIARHLQADVYWKPFFDGFPAVHDWLRTVRPEVVVMFYNDHGLNFFLDKMPTFAVGAAPEYRNADEGWGLPMFRPFAGDVGLSWHIVESLIAAEFDVTTCQEMLLDHAFAIPMALLWPGGDAWPVKVVPIAINTVQHPLPTPARCFRLGEAVGRAIRSQQRDSRVLIVGSGGLSHQLDGARAGFLNTDFDRWCLDRLVHEPQALTSLTNHQLVERAGTQGVELLMWIAARGALGPDARQVHRNYHFPISNTATGLLLMEEAA